MLERFRVARRPTPSAEQTTAHAYWQRCSDTFIASPEYYAKVEQVMTESILPLISHGCSLLDAGCGNGRYTTMMAARARTVEAFDLSPLLIAEARRSAAEGGIRNIRFETADIAEVGRRRGRYQVVSCMGVLSTIIDRPLVVEIVQGLYDRTAPGGMVVLRDSLSLLPEGQLVTSEGYATRYHYAGWYHQTIRDTGLTIESEFLLANFGTCTNAYYVYRRPN